MLNLKKTKTQKSPAHQIRLYKSTQLKTPNHKKNSNSLSRAHQKSQSKQQSFSKSIWVKNTQRDKIDNQIKSHKFIQPSLQTSNCQYYPNPILKKNKTITQKTYAQSQSQDQIKINKNKSYKIQDLLGINSNEVSKKSSIIVTINNKNNQNHQQISGSQFVLGYNQNYTGDQMEKLKYQNKQLMRTNQMLLYEKQYFKQKMILQQVQIRQLQRKIQDMQQPGIKHSDINISPYLCSSKVNYNYNENTQININNKKGHNKNNSQQSDLTFKLRNQNYPQQQQRQIIRQLQRQKTGQKQNGIRTAKKQSRLINLAISSNKSSLLVSQSQQQRIPLKEKQNINLQASGAFSIIKKTQKQFSQLLESVQNQNNINRKTTLRKMLALKAMELKKVKQNY